MSDRLIIVLGGDGASLSELVARLAPRWAERPAEAQRALALRWLDLAVRDALPRAFDAWQGATEAAVIRALPPLTDEATVVQAEVVLRQLARENRYQRMLTTLHAVKHALEQPTVLSPGEASAVVLLTSRFVFGDDRLLETMLADLAVV